MNGVEAIVLTVVLYAMHLRRIGDDAAARLRNAASFRQPPFQSL
jgi:hypothetical protein